MLVVLGEEETEPERGKTSSCPGVYAVCRTIDWTRERMFMKSCHGRVLRESQAATRRFCRTSPIGKKMVCDHAIA